MGYQCVTELKGIQDYLQGATLVAFDFETAPLLQYRSDPKASLDPHRACIVGISLSVAAGSAIYLPLQHFDGGNADPAVIPYLRNALWMNPSITKVAHNLAFEAQFLYALGIVLQPPCFDTIAAAQLTLKGRGWTHWFRSPYIDYITEGSAGDAQTGVEEKDDNANQPAEGGTEESALDLGTRLLYVTPGQPLMQGDDVLAVQTRLLAKGYAPGKLDGVYGNITKAAVVALQTACGIKADGIVGPDTRVFLR